MEAIELLRKYKKRLDPCLKEYFKQKTKQVEKIDPLAKKAIQMIADFTLAGGKRIRPALIYYAYLSLGGEDNDQDIIEASMGIELIHSFLLIHDDIIDRDAKRRNVATIHERYKKIDEKITPLRNNIHFGNSMAMMVGDVASVMSNEIVLNIDFPKEIIIKTLSKLQEIVCTTVYGEMLDVVMEYRGKTTEEEILKMFERKTSRYTFEGPLHLGVILAGGDVKFLQAFTKYSLPLGKAFQLQDDILGIFGDEKKLGKPIGSDIIEGKQTLLVLKALEKGNEEQKKIIKQCLGKKNLTKRELSEFRIILKETGSLAYSQKLTQFFVKESIVALKNIEFKNQEAKIFLTGIAHYIIEREI